MKNEDVADVRHCKACADKVAEAHNVYEAAEKETWNKTVNAEERVQIQKLKAGADEASEHAIDYLCQIYEHHGLDTVLELSDKFTRCLVAKDCSLSGAYCPNVVTFMNTLESFVRIGDGHGYAQRLAPRFPKLWDSPEQIEKDRLQTEHLGRIVESSLVFLSAEKDRSDNDEKAGIIRSLLALMRNANCSQAAWLYGLAEAFKKNSGLLKESYRLNSQDLLLLMFKMAAQEEAKAIAGSFSFHFNEFCRDTTILMGAMGLYFDGKYDKKDKSGAVERVFSCFKEPTEVSFVVQDLCEDDKTLSKGFRELVKKSLRIGASVKQLKHG